MKILCTLIALVLVSSAFSQKKVIDHTAYDGWKTLKNEKISNDGNYITYEVTPLRGDGFLYIFDVKSGTLDSIPRASNASFSGNSNFVAFKINPGFDTLRNCELNKVDKKKWPKDSLGIYVFASDSLMKYPRVSSFEVNAESDWITFMSEDNEWKMTEQKHKKKKKKKNKEEEYTSTGHLLTIFNPVSNEFKEFIDVSKFTVSKFGNRVAFVTHKKTKIDSVELNMVYTPELQEKWSGAQKYTDISGLAFNDQESQLAFLTSSDTSKVKVYGLKLYDIGTSNMRPIADTTQAFLIDGDAVSMNFTPQFTNNGSYLYFGSAVKPVEEPKDTLVESEKVNLDLWHYEEKRLQPQQLKELKSDLRETRLYAYDIANDNAVRLSSDTLNVQPTSDLKGEYLFGMSNESYAHTYNWVTPYPEDHYRVSIKTGESELIRLGTTAGGSLSPSGNYYTYYSNEKHNHFLIDLSTKKEVCVTCSVDNVLWEEDINGMPMEASPLGTLGWNKDEAKLYIQSEFDIWEYTVATADVQSITNEEGSTRKIELRPEVWSRDSVYFDLENIYIKGFNRVTKGNHFFELRQHAGHIDFNELASYEADVYSLKRSKNLAQMTLRKMSAIDYPNLFLADANFMISKQISDANPQQSEYNWTTVELVKWKSYEGIELEGLLYKPENYDAAKHYPLLIYFYELYSHELHTHYTPKPTASIIFPTEYASADYLVFIPDIRYKPGHPAKSAYDCILSGTDHILDLYPNVDSTRMALQGQSWGGYQTAQLVTMTNRYKAAMAGAPVTNMFSAYGGIRWGSGLNRQFQYERTQSRIGYTIWEKPELYFENSPQFHLPNVQTPLLIMHNDGDGAVPWYQGIELYTGLKRLGKTTWMLNYNGEEHNLMRNANRIDLSIRMRQFFDYYLHDKEAPLWLTDGIPATVKGKELRY